MQGTHSESNDRWTRRDDDYERRNAIDVDVLHSAAPPQLGIELNGKDAAVQRTRCVRFVRRSIAWTRNSNNAVPAMSNMSPLLKCAYVSSTSLSTKEPATARKQ